MGKPPENLFELSHLTLQPLTFEVSVPKSPSKYPKLRGCQTNVAKQEQDLQLGGHDSVLFDDLDVLTHLLDQLG